MPGQALYLLNAVRKLPEPQLLLAGALDNANWNIQPNNICQGCARPETTQPEILLQGKDGLVELGCNSLVLDYRIRHEGLAEWLT